MSRLFLLIVFNFSFVCSRKNVLFIVADDMRPDIGAYSKPGESIMHTPNLDALAAKSLLLKNAYVQQAFCSPSRTSFLTSRRPDTTHVYDLKRYFRKVGGNFTTIPQYFKENGYRTIGVGKIFHPGMQASGSDDPISWSEPCIQIEDIEDYDTKNTSWRAVPKEEYEPNPLPDTQLADYAIDILRRVASTEDPSEDKPFFLALGFYKPHLPFVFPEEFLSLYPTDLIKIPDNGHAPINMPYIAWHKYWELLNYRDVQSSGQPNSPLRKDVIMNLRRAYYSTISFVDREIGRVLDELIELGVANNTIISFVGDHGWQLGEHGEWCKHTNFDKAVHAPMMVRIPDVTDQGIVSEELVEFVDLFPTLVEAAEFEAMPLCPEDSSNVTLCTEGSSLMPLIQQPVGSWKAAVFSQYPRYSQGNSVMGYSVKTHEYRYTEWVEFTYVPTFKPNWNNVYGVELYDHTMDPDENYNRVFDMKYNAIKVDLMQILHKGWRNSLPK